MRRRDFVGGLSGAAIALPLVARAQSERIRRIGVLMNLASDDREGRSRLALFQRALQDAGWVDGQNVKIDARWGAGSADQYRKYAAELAALEPDVILAATTPTVVQLRQATRTVPIVFVGVIDPVGSGLVASLSRPGGNVTGFLLFEYALAAKWLDVLKEVAPKLTRVAVLRDPTISSGIGQFAAIQAVGLIGIDLSAIDVRDADEIDRAVAEFSRGPNDGLIVTASQFGSNHPEAVVAVAAKHKLPAVYPFSFFVRAGGLISYGPDLPTQYGVAAGYVDRILKGEKAAELPVQAPNKYELVINLKTAKALGLTLPLSLLARADEVIE
ncbi:MAG TPA: ABC transporter substrate-binding protein [Stellaceae bacterium]|nr:ABC transporter substrate-binding protein [Stellaceae bacterium]